LQVLLFYL